ncbi:hypothetical protein PENSUB_9008 [Penicillium subrubescens]|uniref:BZIP domain-containing protein n=1 Tax=Penicillium subrubescens TaxID=1316194 RepID=A0A1Q5TEU1_9EURO|nr:hypothetical protein PENSUB_9008 [Penicillium subrubescens]
MRVKKSTEPPDSEGASDQKQDPLERRRLQNRLSQRNHRRKIRDRIAKLQERVIANELRAAAALNGWDQPYTPPPLLGSRNLFQQDSGPGNGGADTSSSMTEPFLSFSSSYGLSMTSPWPIAAAQSSTLLSEDSTWLWNIGSSPMDTTYSNLTLCDLMSDATNPSSLGSGEEQPIPDLSSTWSPPHSSASFATPVNQPLYYAVNDGCCAKQDVSMPISKHGTWVAGIDGV